MKRPGDQAKLLLVYLLRSSANALSNNISHQAFGTAAATTSPATVAAGHICLRLARRTDVASIQRCNVATLPENYNAGFYNTHIEKWPHLALVAEHVVPREITTPEYNNNNDFYDDEEPNIVGYILGKVEDRVVPAPLDNNNDNNMLPEYYDMAGRRHVMVPTGHVTSLAVFHEYRRRGIAASLLNQLHFNLEHKHRVRSVGLHVRKGNLAATKMYRSSKFNYRIDEVLNHYYADGEAAYFMKKVFAEDRQQEHPRQHHQQQQQPSSSLRSRLSSSLSKPWFMRDNNESQWQLPRIIWHPPSMQTDSGDDNTISLEEEEETHDVQVMTGT